MIETVWSTLWSSYPWKSAWCKRETVHINIYYSLLTYEITGMLALIWPGKHTLDLNLVNLLNQPTHICFSQIERGRFPVIPYFNRLQYTVYMSPPYRSGLRDRKVLSGSVAWCGSCCVRWCQLCRYCTAPVLHQRPRLPISQNPGSVPAYGGSQFNHLQ